jgi:hypothetical protein
MARSVIPYTFKYQDDKLLFTELDLIVQIMFLDICKYCEERDWPSPIVTSTIRGKLPISISDTHGEGRAIDFRSWSFTRMEIELLLAYVNGKYAEKFGTGPVGCAQIKCLVYEETEGNEHFHLQTIRDYLL